MRTPTYPLVDRALGGQLKELLTGWRADGKSWADIAFLLRTEHDITADATTISRWFAALTEDDTETEAAS